MLMNFKVLYLFDRNLIRLLSISINNIFEGFFAGPRDLTKDFFEGFFAGPGDLPKTFLKFFLS